MEKRANKISKKGQVTIFVIIGIVIVVLSVLVYLFSPNIKYFFGFETQNPSAFMQSCLEDEISEVVGEISVQGGSLNPEHYIMYLGERVEYLCYTEEYYKTCVVQQPMLKNHVEDEIKSAISASASKCLADLKESYQGKGYSVNLGGGNFDVELLPKRISTLFNNSVVISKGSSEKYDSLNVVVNDNLYELVSIAGSIISWETRYGDAETTTYMNYYHDLKVEKKKQSDGSTVYILSDRNTGNKFQFASRSVAWPAGYGVSG